MDEEQRLLEAEQRMLEEEQAKRSQALKVLARQAIESQQAPVGPAIPQAKPLELPKSTTPSYLKPDESVEYSPPAAPGLEPVQQNQDFKAYIDSIPDTQTTTRSSRTIKGKGTRRALEQFETAAAEAARLKEEASIKAAEAESAKGDAIYSHLDEQRELYDKQDAESASIQKEIDEAVKRDAQALKEVSEKRIDPTSYWSSASAARKAMTVIGMALGAAGEALSKGALKNRTLDIINMAIDRDIAAQTANLEQAKWKYQAGRNLVGDLYRKLGSLERAQELARIKLKDNMSTQLQALAAKSGSEVIRANGLAGAQALKMQASQSAVQLYQPYDKRVESVTSPNELKKQLTAGAIRASQAPEGKPLDPKLKEKVRDFIGFNSNVVKLTALRKSTNALSPKWSSRYKTAYEGILNSVALGDYKATTGAAANQEQERKAALAKWDLGVTTADRSISHFQQLRDVNLQNLKSMLDVAASEGQNVAPYYKQITEAYKKSANLKNIAPAKIN